jgi:hypothetical protein
LIAFAEDNRHAFRSAKESHAKQWRFSAALIARDSYDGVTGRGATPTLPDPRHLASREDDVKELNLEEVLRIAGGVPLSAALDELTYRAPAEAAVDVEAARFPAASPHPSEPV